MGTYHIYKSANGNSEHSDDVAYGLRLLLHMRKVTVRTVIFLAALLTLALVFVFLSNILFWSGIGLLSADCGFWLAVRWAKKPWSTMVELIQMISPEYIRTLTLPCCGKWESFQTETAWGRILRSIAGGILGLLLGTLFFPILIPYRLWSNIKLLTLRLPEFIEYFQQAVIRSESEKREAEKRFEAEAVYYMGEDPFGAANENNEKYMDMPVESEEWGTVFHQLFWHMSKVSYN